MTAAYATPETIYLVEERSGSSGGLAYWMTVFLTADEARTAVENRTSRGGEPPLRWEGGRAVMTGRPTTGGNGTSYTIMPLSVYQSGPAEDQWSVPAGGVA